MKEETQAMPAPNSVFTIGYGNRDLDQFLRLLKTYDIQVVCDVRSSPYSSRFPAFSRGELQESLKGGRLRYLFLGDLLGARPSDPDCYEGGRASYDAIAKSSAFQQGIERIETGVERFRIALMCAEKEPLDCHRAILVSRCLVNAGINVLHIDAEGAMETHAELESRLVKLFKLEQISLFQSHSAREVLDEAYARRGRDLAYDAISAYPSAQE